MLSIHFNLHDLDKVDVRVWEPFNLSRRLKIESPRCASLRIRSKSSFTSSRVCAGLTAANGISGFCFSGTRFNLFPYTKRKEEKRSSFRSGTSRFAADVDQSRFSLPESPSGAFIRDAPEPILEKIRDRVSATMGRSNGPIHRSILFCAFLC